MLCQWSIRASKVNIFTFLIHFHIVTIFNWFKLTFVIKTNSNLKELTIRCIYVHKLSLINKFQVIKILNVTIKALEHPTWKKYTVFLWVNHSNNCIYIYSSDHYKVFRLVKNYDWNVKWVFFSFLFCLDIIDFHFILIVFQAIQFISWTRV